MINWAVQRLVLNIHRVMAGNWYLSIYRLVVNWYISVLRLILGIQRLVVV